MANTLGANATLAYFFCRHDLSQSLTERTVIGSLTRQILQSVSDLSSVSLPENPHLSPLAMVSLVDQALLSDTKIYIVLDGLYLCDRSSRELIIEAICKLQDLRKINLCLSHRLDPNSTVEIPKFLNTSIIPQLDNRSDIETFIEIKLNRCIEDRILLFGDLTLLVDIQDALSKGAEGMFL
jgi:hypothetical protein